MYRAYLRTFDGQVSEKSITADQSAAEEAFCSLVNRTNLDGQKLAVALTYNNRQIAFHRFDRRPGDADYWRDKLHEIPWPSGQVGRPSEMEGGKRVQVYLNDDSLAIANKLGNGNINDGIRRALKSSADDMISEVAAEDAAGQRYSHAPGMAL